MLHVRKKWIERLRGAFSVFVIYIYIYIYMTKPTTSNLPKKSDKKTETILQNDFTSIIFLSSSFVLETWPNDNQLRKEIIEIK